MKEEIELIVKLTHHASPGTPVYNALVRHLKRLLDLQYTQTTGGNLERQIFHGRVRAQAGGEPKWLGWHGKTLWEYPLDNGYRMQVWTKGGEVYWTTTPEHLQAFQWDLVSKLERITSYRIWEK